MLPSVPHEPQIGRTFSTIIRFPVLLRCQNDYRWGLLGNGPAVPMCLLGSEPAIEQAQIQRNVCWAARPMREDIWHQRLPPSPLRCKAWSSPPSTPSWKCLLWLHSGILLALRACAYWHWCTVGAPSLPGSMNVLDGTCTTSNAGSTEEPPVLWNLGLGS